MTRSGTTTSAGLLGALSRALDFTFRGLSHHHRRTALLSLAVGRALGLDATQRAALHRAASLHDVGVISFAEQALLHDFETRCAWEHCVRGHRLLKGSVFDDAAETVRCHHDRWDGPNASGLVRDAIPQGSRIIHVADRADTLLDSAAPVLAQRDGIVRRLREQAGTLLDPRVVEAFCDATARDSFWLDLVSDRLDEQTQVLLGESHPLPLTEEVLLGTARIFSRVIDSRSAFTSRHSALVADVAGRLAALAGMDAREQRLMTAAGLLHDLGKLSLADSLLEKPGPLTDPEFAAVRAHPYHTYWILDRAGGLDQVRDWAAHHHERLDGTGYPFRLCGSQLSTGARVLAVADVFAALVEDRPYRAGLGKREVIRILSEMAERRALAHDVVDLAVLHFGQLHRPSTASLAA